MKKWLLLLILLFIPSICFSQNHTQYECDYWYGQLVQKKVWADDAMSDAELMKDATELIKSDAHSAYAQYKLENGANAQIEQLLDDADDDMEEVSSSDNWAFNEYTDGVAEEMGGDYFYSISDWNHCYDCYGLGAGHFHWAEVAAFQVQDNCMEAYPIYEQVITLSQ